MDGSGSRGTREIYKRPELKGPDEVHEQGLTGKTIIRRLDTLGKLMRDGKIDHVLYSAGVDYLRIVEDYYASSSGLAKLAEEAGQVGGVRDPISRYLKARPARLQADGSVTGYVPTQRPRKPSYSKSHSDGWTKARFDNMAAIHRVQHALIDMDRQYGHRSPVANRDGSHDWVMNPAPRRALCMIVIDPSRPDRPTIPVTRAAEIMCGSRGRSIARVEKWLGQALVHLDQWLVEERRAA